MRIGIDARPLSKQRTGIANYVDGLLQFVPALAPQHDLFLYSNRELNHVASKERFELRIDSKFHRCPGALWLLARAGSLANRDHIDAFWGTNPILPFNLSPGVLKVITVYDLVWLRCPETTSRYNLLVQRMTSERAIAAADRIVVISRSTQDELIELLGVPREKTKLVYPGIDDRYRPYPRTEATRYIAHKYGVPERYLATVGIVHPRKNHRFLVQALRVLKNRGQLDCPLLIVGPIGWKNSSLFSEIKSAGLSESDIRFLGYMPNEDMPQFYAGAQAFLFPTLYEGFGLPPVEAMACGAPVISSDAPAMPEVLGDAAILESLTNVERFADAIRSVLVNENLRETLRDKGIRRAATFRYEHSAKQLLEIFEQPVPTGTNAR
jgi:glycosyltransferase involved in cell wall biosynthesis